MEPVWLDAETVKRINEAVLEDEQPHGLNPGSDLEGALYRPKGHYIYGNVSSLYELAAHYAFAVVEAHAFQEGNKRTALGTVRAFLKANSLEFDYSPYEDEAAQIMTGIATGDIEKEEVEEWIRSNTVGAE